MKVDIYTFIRLMTSNEIYSSLAFSTSNIIELDISVFTAGNAAGLDERQNRVIVHTQSPQDAIHVGSGTSRCSGSNEVEALVIPNYALYSTSLVSRSRASSIVPR